MKIVKAILILFFVHDVLGRNGRSFIKHMSETVGRTVLECKKVSEFGNDVISEFLNFWEPKQSLKNLEMGCVVICVLVKLDLVDANGSVKMANLKMFSKANGADESDIIKLQAVFKECVKPLKEKNVCATGLAAAQCFRRKIFELHWQPSGYSVYDENFSL